MKELFMEKNVPLIEKELTELEFVTKRVAKFRRHYALTAIFTTIILIFLLVSFFVIFHWMFLLLAIMIATVLFRTYQFARQFSETLNQLKKDKQYGNKNCVSGKLSSAYIADRNIIYIIDNQTCIVKHWQTFIGWRVHGFDYIPDTEIEIQFLPNSGMLLAANYIVSDNTITSKPLNEEQQKAFKSAKLNLSQNKEITGIVTEKFDMWFKVGAMLVPVKLSNIVTSINASQVSYIRLGSELYQLNNTQNFKIAESATLQVFE